MIIRLSDQNTLIIYDVNRNIFDASKIMKIFVLNLLSSLGGPAINQNKSMEVIAHSGNMIVKSCSRKAEQSENMKNIKQELPEQDGDIAGI